jgi:microcystin-dependent protein
MSEPFIGIITIFGGNFAPVGWAYCNGQQMPIAQYEALFTLLGTTYGGDGQNTFALPDMRSRMPIHSGQGTGLSQYRVGQTGGSEQVTLLANQMPPHNHVARASTTSNQTVPTNNVWGGGDSSSPTALYTSGPVDATMSSKATNGAGGSQPHQNVQPILAMNFIIALEGIYPSQA